MCVVQIKVDIGWRPETDCPRGKIIREAIKRNNVVGSETDRNYVMYWETFI